MVRPSTRKWSFFSYLIELSVLFLLRRSRLDRCFQRADMIITEDCCYIDPVIGQGKAQPELCKMRSHRSVGFGDTVERPFLIHDHAEDAVPVIGATADRQLVDMKALYFIAVKPPETGPRQPEQITPSGIAFPALRQCDHRQVGGDVSGFNIGARGQLSTQALPTPVIVNLLLLWEHHLVP